jgi:Fur family iron response transcriptional regulator
MSKLATELQIKLAQAGLRLTQQRLALAEILFGKGHRHLTAEMLYEEARQMVSPPSLATVYNTLHSFAEHGLVREIALYGSKIWFDTKTGPHFHFYIESRDELFDIPDELIPMFEVRAPEGTTVIGIDVVVRLKQGSKITSMIGRTSQVEVARPEHQ